MWAAAEKLVGNEEVSVVIHASFTHVAHVQAWLWYRKRSVILIWVDFGRKYILWAVEGMKRLRVRSMSHSHPHSHIRTQSHMLVNCGHAEVRSEATPQPRGGGEWRSFPFSCSETTGAWGQGGEPKVKPGLTSRSLQFAPLRSYQSPV